MEESRSISISGSNQLTWEIIDKRANDLNFKKTSQYFQHLAEEDIYKKKDKIKNHEIVLYSLYSLILLVFFALMLQMTGVF